MYRSGDSNDLSLAQSMDIHVWRGNGAYELYEDDGETCAYQNGSKIITAMHTEETKDMIRFTISAPAGDLSLIQGYRDWNIRFRDVVSAEVTVNGIPAASSAKDHVCISVNGGEKTTIELHKYVVMGNRPVQDLTADLLTRVQGSNIWKAANFPTVHTPERRKKLPKDIRLALDEFDALVY